MPDTSTLPTLRDALALGLTAAEYELVCEKQDGAPNQVELAMYSLLWSEHCAYKHSKKLLRTLPTEGEHVVMGPGENAGAVVQTVAFMLLVSLLALSAIAYMTARLGFYYRARTHRRAARATLDEFFATRQPALTALVPSYQEDQRVIRMTLLSAALQEYPNLRIVLLIDDPPNPRYSAQHRLLEDARSLPDEIEMLLAAPSSRFTIATQRFIASRQWATTSTPPRPRSRPPSRASTPPR